MGNSPLLPKAKIWEDQYFTETAEPGRVSLVRAGEWISPSVFPSGRCGRRARSRFYSFTHLRATPRRRRLDRDLDCEPAAYLGCRILCAHQHSAVLEEPDGAADRGRQRQPRARSAVQRIRVEAA